MALREHAALLLVGVQVTEPSGAGLHTPLVMVGLCALFSLPTSELISSILNFLIKPTKDISLIPGI